ncbi:MAG: hypothetical protein QXG00_00275 [Candidatus Woesearchaeota archaeon]
MNNKSQAGGHIVEIIIVVLVIIVAAALIYFLIIKPSMHVNKCEGEIGGQALYCSSTSNCQPGDQPLDEKNCGENKVCCMRAFS